MNWLHYLLEANIYLGVFYLAYCLFLNKETHYFLNRIYLVFSCVIAFVLPVLQLGMLLPPPPPPPMAPVNYVPVPIADIPAVITPIVEQHFTLQDGLWYAYLAGTIIFFIILIIKLFSLVRLIGTKQVIKQADYKLIYLADSNGAFSFFNYLFIGNNTSQNNIIIRHELVHIRQKHSADIMFIELLKVVNWFNPFIYLLQNSLKTVHEYIADEHTIDHEADAISYSSFLVNNAYGVSGPAITHSFFNYNLLKKRIIMLNQQRSGKLARLKYLVAVPIGAALLCASTLGFSKTYGWVDLAPIKPADNVQYYEGPPTVLENAYVGLMNHIEKNIRYKKDDVGKTGFVLVDFTITKNHKLNYINVRETTPRIRLRDEIQSLFKSYTGSINDKPGMHTLSVIFNSGTDNLKVSPEIKKLPGYAGEIVLTTPPPPPNSPKAKMSFFTPPPPKPKVDQVRFPIPDMPGGFKPEKTYVNEKGYKIEEGGYAARGKTFYRVNISDPSGKKVLYATGFTAKKLVYFKGINDKQQTKWLYDKYGYAFPDVQVTPIPLEPPPPPEPQRPKNDQIKFPPPIVKPDKSSQQVKVDNYKKTPISERYFNAFTGLRTYLSKNIRYPKEARDQNISKNITATFNIDAEGHIKDAKISNNSSEYFDEAILKALNAYAEKIAIRADTYSLVFQFHIETDGAKKFPPPVILTPGLAGVITIIGYK